MTSGLLGNHELVQEGTSSISVIFHVGVTFLQLRVVSILFHPRPPAFTNMKNVFWISSLCQHVVYFQRLYVHLLSIPSQLYHTLPSDSCTQWQFPQGRIVRCWEEVRKPNAGSLPRTCAKVVCWNPYSVAGNLLTWTWQEWIRLRGHTIRNYADKREKCLESSGRLAPLRP